MKRKGTEQVPEAIPDEMGEFEDAWEDEFEEEEEYAEEHSEEMEDSEGEEEIDEEQDEEMENVPKGKIYMPGQPLNEDEVLVADPTVYDMLHSMNVEWPCLSFDILRDAVSPGYPFTCYLAAGSQADSFDANQIYLMKISNMYKTKQQLSDSESDDDDDALDEDPILEYKTVRHKGSVNRIRAMPHQKSHIIASMSEDSNVYIYDATQLIDSLDTPGLVPQTNPLIHTIKSHRAEGYALDWSRHETGHLLTGDISSKILMTSKTNTGFVTSKEYFSGHESSIEDIQWSQSSLFASCSADKTIRLWDSRIKGKAQFCVKAHDSDVNVIHWNRYV
jgi:ribosome assembly protein RRB1